MEIVNITISLNLLFAVKYLQKNSSKLLQTHSGNRGTYEPLSTLRLVLLGISNMPIDDFSQEVLPVFIGITSKSSTFFSKALKTRYQCHLLLNSQSQCSYCPKQEGLQKKGFTSALNLQLKTQSLRSFRSYVGMVNFFSTEGATTKGIMHNTAKYFRICPHSKNFRFPMKIFFKTSPES